MRKIYLMLVPMLASAVVCQASQAVKAIRQDARHSMNSASLRHIDLRCDASAPVMLSGSPAKEVAGPSDSDGIITEAPEGNIRTMEKYGFSYGYNWFVGLVTERCDGSVEDWVFTDNGEVYVSNPIMFCYGAGAHYVKGTVEGDIISFRFPQMISTSEYSDGIANDYLVKLEFVPEHEGSQDGWYFPSADQTYTMHLLPDGTIKADDPDAMWGMCNWMESEDNPGEFGWSWQGNGDFIDYMSPLTASVVEVPARVEFEQWNFIEGISGRPMRVGIDGSDIYLKDIFPRGNVSDNAIRGTISDGRAVFPTCQFLGVMDGELRTLYFVSGTLSDDGLEVVFDKDEELVLDYDSEKKVLSTDTGAFMTTSSDMELYWTMVNHPYIAYPRETVSVTRLLNPVIEQFMPYDYEEDIDAEIYFLFPVVDADHQMLDTARLYYQIILDGEVFTFYSDEYELPEGVEETTDIPFDYNSEEELDFYADGISHGLIIYPRGYDTIGVRTLYKGETTVYSDIAWVEGYEPDSVELTGNDSSVSVEYYDLTGIHVVNPSKGTYIMRTVDSDGNIRNSKAIVRK